MSHKLKPLNEQVIVITGASSGIGLATARSAASRGAKVVVGSRAEDTLEEVVRQIIADGGDAIWVGCDVGNRAQVDQLAAAAIAKYGRIDTWVNNAGASVYGRLDQVSEEDCRKVFETNFWGVFHGSLVALPHLRAQGGALINVGSEVSEAVIPLQGIYSASKHAVKGFTDVLRVEVEEIDKAPVSITLIQPTAVDTPFPQHAKNYMDKEPKLPTPMIDPQQVADAILDAAVTPTRAKRVGTMSKLNTAVAKFAPALGDKMAAKQAERQQYDEAPLNPDGALHHTSETGHVHGRSPAERR